MATKGSGTVQKKICLLLLGGLALGLTHSPRSYFKILKGISEEWRKIDEKALKRAIRSLYRTKVIEEKQNKDGSVAMVLSENGKKRTLVFQLDAIVN